MKMCIRDRSYIALKTEGPIRERARNYAEILYGVLYVGLVVFAAVSYTHLDVYKRQG